MTWISCGGLRGTGSEEAFAALVSRLFVLCLLGGAETGEGRASGRGGHADRVHHSRPQSRFVWPWDDRFRLGSVRPHATLAKALTTPRRRQQREQEAFVQSQSNEPETQAWHQIKPLLEAAMSQLPEKIMAPSFSATSRAGISGSAALGTTEAAAKMRVSRALMRMRLFFAKRGVTLSVTAIAEAVSAHSIQAAPTGLAASITAAKVSGAAMSASTTELINTTLKIMAWTNSKPL